jgi:ATP phosphoribosyltransferase regulatory subunit
MELLREGTGQKRLSSKKMKVLIETLSFFLLNVVSLPQALSSLESLLSCLPHDQIDESFLTLIKEWTHGPSEIVLDLALAPVGPYYSGMFFHLYTPGSTREIASGGRYDKLPSLFGANIPATGFAFHLNRIDDATSIGKEIRDREEIHFLLQTGDSGTYHLIEKLISGLTQNRHTVRILYPNPFPGNSELDSLDYSYFEKFPNVSEVIWKKGDDFISFLKNGSSHKISQREHLSSNEGPFLSQERHPNPS